MFYIGTSGWAYPQWEPRFYPADLPPRRFLKFYSTQLNAVKVNYPHKLLRVAVTLWPQHRA